MEVKHGSRPIVVDETPGTKAYCQCGLSAKLPYCDGSHSKRGTTARPMVVEVTEAARKAICQCHRSAKLPWCDGAHKNPA